MTVAPDAAATLRPKGGLVPPQDLRAEAAVLSAALNADDARTDLLGTLTPEDFYSASNRWVFAAIRELSEQGSAVDLVTVRAWLAACGRLQQVGGAQYLVQIADGTPAIANYLDHARIVADKRRMRSMIVTLQGAAAEGYGDVGGAQGWFDAVEERIASVARSAATIGLRPMRDVGLEAFEQIQRASEQSGSVGASTGYPDLDRILGGLMDGDFYVLAARPGMGKTALALNIASSIATAPPGNGEPGVADAAAVFSLEMGAEQLGLRMICSEAKVDARACRAGQVRADWWAPLANAVELIGQRPIYVDDTAAVSMREIRARAARLARAIEAKAAPVRARRLGLVVIDYLQLVGGERKRDQNREQFVSEQSQACKLLAKELEVPVIALSQLNRSLELRSEKRPTLPDLRESGAIEQDADGVMFIYRDDYYHRDSDRTGEAEVIVAKQRNGPTGVAHLRFNAACTRFDSLALGDYEEYDPAADFPD